MTQRKKMLILKTLKVWTRLTYNNNSKIPESPTSIFPKQTLCGNQLNPSQVPTKENVADKSFEGDKKWSQWKPTSLRSKKHPALSKSKPKRPFEKLAEAKLEVANLLNIYIKKKILEEELKLKMKEMEENKKGGHLKKKIDSEN